MLCAHHTKNISENVAELAIIKNMIRQVFAVLLLFIKAHIFVCEKRCSEGSRSDSITVKGCCLLRTSVHLMPDIQALQLLLQTVRQPEAVSSFMGCLFCMVLLYFKGADSKYFR